MEAVPLPDCKAETASKAFYEHWVCRFGVPGKIITDQGRRFESQLFRSLAAICWAKVAHATSYHPQCNEKGERLHRTLKGAIKAHNNIKWTETLPTILLGLRTALRPDTNHTIAQMVYGSNIRLPGEFFNPPSIQIDPETFVTTLQTFMDELKPKKSSSPKSQKIFVHKDLKSCPHVFVRVDRVRKALEPPYDGPFPVKERHEKYFTLTIKNKPVNISVDRLKPAYLLMTDSIPDKTTVPCKQSDENSAANDTNLLTDVKPTVSRHGRLVKKPQDNDPKHTAGITRMWLIYHVPRKLATPPQSPDLNPLENVWNSLDLKIRKRKISSKSALKQALIEEWSNTDPTVTENLIK
ncbi:retrovirus-related Pol polyprotein from transposon opus [Trichonephila clavipes]|nr:retrovirus-related Pol polyprotein from transposon opus [Trichonephila clavipes]